MISRLKLIRVLRGIGDPSGSEKVNAIASAESGEGIPRFRMSCLDSSTSLPELSYLYPQLVRSACKASSSVRYARPCIRRKNGSACRCF
jgi:hypothetical protein